MFDTTNFIDPVTVMAQGTVVSFARTPGACEKLYYRVRDPAALPLAPGEWNSWTELNLAQPSSSAGDASADVQPMLRIAGADLVTLPLPMLHVLGAAVAPKAADAPYAVVADGSTVVCIRVSVTGTLLIDRFVLVANAQGQTSASSASTNGFTLVRMREARFRRSGLRDVGAGPEDALGTENMAGEPFYEPTTELTVLPRVAPGWHGSFAVLLSPTAEGGKNRWHFFISTSNGIVCASFAQDSTGRVDPNTSAAQFILQPVALDANGQQVLDAGGNPLVLACAGPLAASLYQDMEQAATSSGGTASLRRGQRVLLTAVVTYPTAQTNATCFAAYDFAVRLDGTLPAPNSAGCVVIDGAFQNGVFAGAPTTAGGSFPVPSVAVQSIDAATVTGILLAQPTPASEFAPSLLNSADGMVHLYFGTGGVPGPFMACQFSPLVVRAQVNVPWQSPSGAPGVLAFVAAYAGTSMSGMTVACTPDPTGATLSLDVDYGASSLLGRETWAGLPNDVAQVIEILSGSAKGDAFDPDVLSGTSVFYDYLGQYSQLVIPAALPVANGMGNAALRLVSHRTDVALSAATVAAWPGSSKHLSLVLTYTLPGGAQATQTWKVPLSAADAAQVLGGGVQYTTRPGVQDTALYGLDTDAGMAILIFSTRGDLQIQIVDADDESANDCKMIVTPSGAPAVSVDALPRAQEAFIEAVTANASLSPFFAYLSPAPLPGSVNNASCRRMTPQETAVLVDAIGPQSTAATLVADNYSGAVTQGHTVTSSLPINEPIDRLVAASVESVPALPLGIPCTLQAFEGGLSNDVRNGSWMVSPQPQGATFTNAATLSVAVAHPGAIAPGREFTLESWVAPNGDGPGCVVAQKGHTGASRYALTVSGGYGLEFLPYTDATQAGYVALCNGQLPPELATLSLAAQGSVFTFEAWIYWVSGTPPAVSVIYQVAAQDASPCPSVWIDANGYLWFSPPGDTSGTCSNVAVEPGMLFHLAISGRNISDPTPVWEGRYYIGGKPCGGWGWQPSATGLPAAQPLTPSMLPPYTITIGAAGASASAPGGLVGIYNEFRIWNVERNEVDIQSTMNAPLVGEPAGLQFYFPLSEAPGATQVADLGPHHLLATYSNQGVSQVSNGVFEQVEFAAGEATPVAANSLMVDRWNHLAGTYTQGGGLRFTPPKALNDVPTYAVCTQVEGLQLGSGGTIEGWIQVGNTLANDQVVLALWGSASSQQSYRIVLKANATLFAEVTVMRGDSPTRCQVNCEVNLRGGGWHHFALRVESENDGSERAIRLTVVIDTLWRERQTYRVVADSVQSVQSPLTLGCIGIPTDMPVGNAMLLNASLALLRFWSAPLTDTQIDAAKRLKGRFQAPGLVACWNFGELEGDTAHDSAGRNVLTLSDSRMWTPASDFSSLDLYVNGLAVPSWENRSFDGRYPIKDGTFTVGGCATSAGTQSPIAGDIAEVRLWQACRTLSQLQSDMFRPLAGNEKGLCGYWPFNGSFDDLSPQGNDATNGSGGVAFSYFSLPVSIELPYVQGIYGMGYNQWESNIRNAPAVIEFATADFSAGMPTDATLYRAVIWQSGEGLRTETSYGIGGVDTLYLGQVQTNPEVVGFAEGAPPVPSENLSRPLYESALGYNNYAGSSSLELAEKYKAKLTLSSESADSSILGYKAKMARGFDTFYSTFGLRTADDSILFGGRSEVKGTRTNTDALDLESTAVRSQIFSVSLRGQWEQLNAQGAYLDPQVGRRYLPYNKGVAVVETLVADLYAFQLKGTNVMVGQAAVASEDQPRMRSLLTFAISPTYVKNGTLDGKVGFANDPDYPEADFVRGSYFRPTEANQIEAVIERQQADFAGYWASVNPYRATAPLSDAYLGATFSAEGGLPQQEVGLANTYTWSASGGLLKEQEQTVSVVKHKFTHGFKSEFEAAVLADIKLKNMFFGFTATLDVFANATFERKVTKGSEDESEVGLIVNAPGESLLLGYDGASKTYTPGDAPGKVLTYQFKSFFLPASAQNGATFFTEVVDQSWLWTSSDPNAAALRCANLEGAPWRILHRVTYVNRVPPPFNSNPVQSVAPAVPAGIDVQNNAYLLLLVESAMGTAPASPVNVGAAVATALSASTTGSLALSVPWWTALVGNAAADDAAAACLLVIQNAANSYVQAGYANRQLPMAIPTPRSYAVRTKRFRRAWLPEGHVPP